MCTRRLVSLENTIPNPKVRIFTYTIYACFDYVIELSYILFFFFLLYSYFEAMFRSFMPEDNTVTVSKTPVIGDKTELLFFMNSKCH